MVQLKRSNALDSCNSRCLIGEVKEIKLLNDIHVLLNSEESVSTYVYYVEGLRIILKFHLQGGEEAYLQDELKWNKWLNWLISGFMEESLPERLVTVRIMGLPVHLRSDDNIISIASRFGKVFEADGHNWNIVDLSTCFATILSNYWKVINNEVIAMFNDKHFTVGVMECENNWEPFFNQTFPEPPLSDFGDTDGVGGGMKNMMISRRRNLMRRVFQTHGLIKKSQMRLKKAKL